MGRKETYMSDEWKVLDPLNRACILPVSEGVKPGTTFSSRYRVGVERVLEELGLPYQPPYWATNGYSYTVAKDDKTLSDYVSRFLKRDLTAKQAHRANGVFYGIPECCIDYFAGGVLDDQEWLRKKNFSFEDSKTEYERLNGSYPEELDYGIPGVTPCKVDCGNALKAFGEYRDVLLEYDREAAEELKLFNQRGYRILSRGNI